MKIQKTLLLAALTSLSVTGFAEESQTSDIKVGFNLAAGFGGDKLLEVEFTDGSTDEIEAGGGLLLGVSFQKPLQSAGSTPLSGKLAINYMFDSISGTNGDADFTRLPIDLMLMTQSEKLSFGGGITYHLNPTLSVDLPGLSGEIDFDNALGFKLEANYHVNNSNLSFGVEYTSIDYKVDNISVDGSGFNINMKALY